MAGGGKRRATNDRKRGGGGGNTKSRTRGKPTTGRRIRDGLFVEGGILADFASPPGRSRNASAHFGPRTGSSDRIKALLVASKSGTHKSNGDSVSYAYPVVEPQEDLHKEPSADSKDKNSKDKPQPFLLVGPKDAQVIAYVDETPCSEARTVEYAYNYGTSFVLGESSHRGLGFNDEFEACSDGVGSPSRKEVDYEEGKLANILPSDDEMDGIVADQQKGIDAVEAIAFDFGEEIPSHQVSLKENSAFITIGGMKLFTQDRPDGESDKDYADSAEDSSVFSESGEGFKFSESDGSDVAFDSDSDIDEELAEDYLEGIGGKENVLNAKWLLGNNSNDSDEDTTSSSDFDDTVKKLGGIDLLDASREYGMKMPRSRKNYPAIETKVHLSTFDDIMLFRDPRTVSARKKHVPCMPQSWPRRSKSSRNFPGEKKKHRKERIADKRRDRMLNRGVDLENINKKLEHIVSERVDVFSFQPMDSKDCSQVQRLAAIYRLRSVSQGFSGKKRFVTVSRTQHTSMPSASDRIRLEKFIGSEDADIAFREVQKSKSASGGKTKKFDMGSAAIPSGTQGRSRSAKKLSSSQTGSMSRKRGSMKEFNAREPVLFVSSGMIQTDNAESMMADSTEACKTSESKAVLSSANVGSFELYTKGFGSRMMAKMGYVEGEGLGKAGQGMSRAIEVIQRPKSLGLGIDFSNTTEDPVENRPRRSVDTKKHRKGQSIGAFEKHTRGFGSKMMAKMRFTEGMGLGRDSQGITNPLVAVRLPKSRGLGAEK